MAGRMEGKVALVTGAARGIGAAISEALKAAGYPGRLLNLEGGMRAWVSRRP